VEFGWKGPIKQWTAELDLERQELVVFGRAQSGYFSYRLKRQGDSLVLLVDKVPPATACRSSVLTEQTLEKRQSLSLMTLGKCQELPVLSRLSLGSHKAQEMSKIRERRDPCELIPLWLRVADLCEKFEGKRGKKGHYALLKVCEEGDKLEIVQQWMAFFSSAFTGVFVPRLIDTEHQGIVACEPEAGVSALPLLYDSAALIRSLFYREGNGNRVAILPALPPEFHCGRFINIALSSGVMLSFEWTKKKLRRVLLSASQEVDIVLQLPHAIASCRCKSKQTGLRQLDVKAHEVCCTLASGEKMELDRFHAS
jgi:hypothetical protein